MRMTAIYTLFVIVIGTTQFEAVWGTNVIKTVPNQLTIAKNDSTNQTVYRENAATYNFFDMWRFRLVVITYRSTMNLEDARTWVGGGQLLRATDVVTHPGCVTQMVSINLTNDYATIWLDQPGLNPGTQATVTVNAANFTFGEYSVNDSNFTVRVSPASSKKKVR